MKIFLSIITLIIVLFSQAAAQEQTLLGDGEISNGGFGGPVVKYVQIKGESGVLVGGRGGWIINHSFVLGGGGYGLVNNIKAGIPPVIDIYGNTHDAYINFGYGGVELEYIIQSDRVLHFSVYSLIGAGSISFRNEQWNDHHDGDWNTAEDAFFVFEPAVNAELNVVSFMRISAGLSYRVISGVELDNMSNSDFAGFSGTLTFKFGSF